MSDAPPALTTLDWVVTQAWDTLAVPTTGKNSIFHKVFFDEEMLSEIATAADLTFCPGLLDVVLSPTPPDISFFKNTPSKYLGLWGVYNLVLEKPGCIPLVYIGEASNKDTGIPARWKVYNNLDIPSNRKALPSKVREALDDGFKIVHKGVLAYCPIPSAKNVPRFRVLNYSLEATFSFYFWTMFPKAGDYQIASCCPWPRESFTYGGLCSHSSLNDPMRAKFGLSPAELEELAAQEAARYSCELCGISYHSQWGIDRHNVSGKHQKRVAKRAAGVEFKYRCDICDKNFQTPKEQNKHEKGSRHLERLAKNGIKLPEPEAPKPRPKLYCEACNQDFDTPSKQLRHNNSKTHEKRVEKLAAGVDFKYRCDICDKNFQTPKEQNKHAKGSRHMERVAAAAAAAA